MKRALLAAAAALAAVACSENKPKVLAKLDDGALYRATYTCAKEGCTLAIETKPAISLPVEACDDVTLAEEAAGKAVAYRCRGGPWRVVRLRGGDRYLQDCISVLGTAQKPDWSKVAPIEPQAMQLLECAHGSSRAWAEIARSIAEENGEKGAELAAKYVVATTLHPSPTMGKASQGYPDGWALAVQALSPAGQEIVRKETCPALQKSAAPSLLYVRAGRICPFDGPNVGDVALGALKNHLDAPRSDFTGLTERNDAKAPPDDLSPPELAFAMEGLIALKQRPKEAAETSCAHIGDYSREFDPVRVSVAGSILALSKTRCEAVDKKSPLWPCDLVAPQKSALAAEVAKFGATPPELPSANAAMFEALSIDGKYPPNWRCP